MAQDTAPSAPHGRHAAHEQRPARAAQTQGDPARPQDASATRPAQDAAQGRRGVRASNVPVVDTADEQDAPRPIGVNPSETGSFQHISASEGARVENRDNVGSVSADSTSSWSNVGMGAQKRMGKAHRPLRRKEAPTDGPMSGRMRWAVALLAVLVLVILFFLLRSCLDAGQTEAPQQAQVEQTQTTPAGSIEYRGTTYSIEKQDDGTYALVGRTDSAADATVFMQFDGEPIQLVLYNGAFIIPENTSDGWDVMAYTIGSGSVGSQVVDADGEPVGETGHTISSVELKESEGTMLVTDDAGTVTTVALAF